MTQHRDKLTNINREFLQAHRSRLPSRSRSRARSVRGVGDRGPSRDFATRANVTRSTGMAPSTSTFIVFAHKLHAYLEQVLFLF